MVSEGRLTPRAYWIVSLMAVVWIATIGIRPLYDPDEGRYAEIPREMLAGGDWIVPHLNYVIYLEKPPLAYWITAAGYKLFGISEWTARLPNAVCYLATCLAIFLAGRIFMETGAAFRAAWMFATSLLPILMGRYLTLDFSLTFFLSAALFLIGMAESGRGGRKAVIAGWLLAGLATLVKGPVALVLSIGVLILFRIFRRISPLDSQPTAPPIRWHLGGFILAAAVCSPWFYEVGRRVEPFWRFFIVDQHVRRFEGSEHAMPFWFYVPVVALGFFPWTIGVLKTLSPAKFKPAVTDPFQRWCWCWAAVVFLFFSASGGKLVAYILPLFAPLALIAACHADDKTDRQTAMAAGGIFILLAAVLALTPIPERYGDALDWVRMPLCVLFSVGAALAIWLTRQGRREAVHIPAFFLCMFVLFVEIGGSDPDAHRTAYSFRRQLQESPAPLISYGDYFQSANFYSHRRMVLTNHLGELAFGSGFPGAKEWFWNDSQMSDFIASGKPALVIMKATTFHESFQSRPRVREIGQAASLILASINQDGPEKQSTSGDGGGF